MRIIFWSTEPKNSEGKESRLHEATRKFILTAFAIIGYRYANPCFYEYKEESETVCNILYQIGRHHLEIQNILVREQT